MPNPKEAVNSIHEFSRALNAIYVQMLIIVITFIIMGAACIWLAGRIVGKQLEKDAENIIAITRAELNTNLVEPETFLQDYSNTIRGMLLSGADENAVFLYYGRHDRFNGK